MKTRPNPAASSLTALPTRHRRATKRSANRGFALIITISMMVLLTLLSVGLLSLSTISLRSSTSGSAQAEARANARLALELAIGELQKSLGDDRRITADGDFFENAGNPNAVGVWESWSPNLASNPLGGSPNYDAAKRDNFLRWLVSGDPDDLTEQDWAKSAPDDSDFVPLFLEESDGFSLGGEIVNFDGDNPSGSFAWAISQAATKAKVTVAGPEADERVANDDLQVQPRPSLAISALLGDPSGGWNERAARVVGFNQAELDEGLWQGDGSRLAQPHFTTVGSGLLTNVVEGGLKVDMNLGFEMDESDFEAESWPSDGERIDNPFVGAANDSSPIPGGYEDQRPLYQPLEDEGSFEVQQRFWPANVEYHFPITSVPTFHSIRSFYRTAHHLYRSKGKLTAFERPADHVAGEAGRISRGFYEPPTAGVDGSRTQQGIRPVMNRVMYLISGGLSQNDELRIVITPIIALWNPYNVALEIEGAVSHVWIDIPYEFQWRTYNSNGRPGSSDYMYMSGLMGKQFNNQGHSRSVDPYFFAAMTATGEPLSESGTAEAIRFEPGEVRVFAPSEQEFTEFDVSGTIRDRTIFMRPVDSLSQFTTRGGLSVPTRNPVINAGFVRRLTQGQSAQITFNANTYNGNSYPFYISLEDATRAKGSNPQREDRGKAIADVLAENFSGSGETTIFKSARIPYAQLKQEPIPIGVLESYHRVAKSGGAAQVSDLVFTGNPRQPWMNPFISDSNFKTGPQYESRMRAVSSFNGVIQTANEGRSAYWGPSQTPNGGRTNLSFFELPSSPILSLAALQHGDFSSTPFAPANQVANSWASAYVPRDKVSSGPLQVDHCYLLNEALWDGWFFSGAAPTLTHSEQTGSERVWDNETAQITRPLEAVLAEFIDSPTENPLRNPRMRPAGTVADPDEWVESLLKPEGSVKIAAELVVDGAFNVNSTSVEAWTAVLSGLRGASFEVDESTANSSDETPFPRFRDPVGTSNDNWHGYRALSDEDIAALATELVDEIRSRGPFQSLGEFVNRRVSQDDLGLKGALQAAIDEAGLNQAALQDSFSTDNYGSEGSSNITPNDTGVGIPGYLTQADVLKPLAPVITVRSDTFTVRAYGNSVDAAGNVLAQAWVEAVIQRVPDFIDPADAAHTPLSDLSETNQRFGRRLEMISFRFIPDAERRL